MTSEQKKDDLWTIIFPFWDILVKVIDRPLNFICHLNSTNSIKHNHRKIRKSSWNLYSDSIHPKRPLCIHFHLFCIMLLNWSESRCIKHVPETSKDTRFSIWWMEIKILGLHTIQNLTVCHLMTNTIQTLGTIKDRQKEIKPYLPLTCPCFSISHTDDTKKEKIISMQRLKARALYFVFGRFENQFFHTTFSPLSIPVYLTTETQSCQGLQILKLTTAPDKSILLSIHIT